MSKIYTLLCEDTGKRIYISVTYTQMWRKWLVIIL